MSLSTFCAAMMSRDAPLISFCATQAFCAKPGISVFRYFGISALHIKANLHKKSEGCTKRWRTESDGGCALGAVRRFFGEEFGRASYKQESATHANEDSNY